ncbi:succinylarginine dihydrolase [Sphingomonas koreensis]|jgi:succinylarginine dihydrolase|uniref:N-succinylarginine dihydrolase n=1 Tax=Sphingomonas koreensis TaxID=93064 RepID=A0A1L6JD20_9SPHN|nr:N-succinylarginine dihydrolase [Sphingomonas koreensis]APR53794.1 succinylarginine dihydrolase [Sphingomonas koreensis]MDC7808643.1 N-succinylarginine dihydrolase [Sphingomonas koreensis]RSU17874.1 succinylarginine dihydrolase [Sphingomonas koreensis]RSU23234.1 succinylarginine dihydrolase [Sphingomonas koreensis]RSU23327.1 succinylarginine dihydrolase [Sphingomonas koreensis]
MPLVEINFDGLIGPSHNYAGLSPGNLAATRNSGAVSQPRAAALQGIAKMRANLALGLTQGILLPHARPDHRWLDSLATSYTDAAAHLQAQALSASSMWAANAATVSPAPDTADGRCHLTVANLVTMPHRSHEWPGTLAQLRLAFGNDAFRVHGPVPAPFGDEGAANHMRLCPEHDAPGVEVFVYGISGGPFPARQHREASEAVARRHGLDPARTLFVQQSEAAIAAGAFHNDVVAVANGRVLFAHEQAFADKQGFYADLRRVMPEVEIVEVPASAVNLADAISSYLFNAQLVTLPSGETALVLPTEAGDTPSVWAWLQAHVAGNGPIRHLEVVDVRQSMANGGGPACLRLRVVADPATIDPRFLVDAGKLDRIAALVEMHWPETIAQNEIGDPALIARIETARAALLDLLGIVELIDS